MNYNQNVFFAPKDALLTGDPAKRLKGTEIDAELAEISTAIASKQESSEKGQVNGFPALDAGGKIPVGQLPPGTAAAVGVVELATDAEAVSATDTTRAVTPASVAAVLKANNGLLWDIGYDLGPTVPSTDALPLWKPAASAMQWAVLDGSYLKMEGTTLTLGIGAVNAALNHDTLPGFAPTEHVDHATVQVVAGDGLYGGGPITGTVTLNVFGGQGMAVGADYIQLSFANLVINATDSYYATSVGVRGQADGTIRQIPYYLDGVPNKTVDVASYTITTDDVNRMLFCSSDSPTTISIPSGFGAKGNVVLLCQTGNGQVTVGGTAQLLNGSGLKSRVKFGVISLMCTDPGLWLVFGDTIA